MKAIIVPIPHEKKDKEDLVKEEQWILNIVKQVLAKDWESEEDNFWDNY